MTRPGAPAARFAALFALVTLPPIFTVTAAAMEYEPRRSEEAGMDDYITEPGESDDHPGVDRRMAASEGERKETPAGRTPPTEPPDQPVLDRELVAQLEELDAASGDDVPSFVAEFLTSSVAMLESVRGAVAAEDVEGVKFHAHALKGSAATLGARRASTLCAALEALVPEWDPREANRLVDRITVALDRAAVELGMPQLGPITARDR